MLLQVTFWTDERVSGKACQFDEPVELCPPRNPPALFIAGDGVPGDTTEFRELRLGDPAPVPPSP
jgi:hypothetical protein